MSGQAPTPALTAPSPAAAADLDRLQLRMRALQEEDSFKRLIRPEHCTFQTLGRIGIDKDGCQKYYNGVTNFWRSLVTNPEGSKEYDLAKQKLVEMTTKISGLLKAQAAEETKRNEAQSRQAVQTSGQAATTNQQAKVDSPKVSQQQLNLLAVGTDLLDPAVHKSIENETQIIRWTAPAHMNQKQAQEWLQVAPQRHKTAVTKYRQSEAALKHLNSLEAQPGNKNNPAIEKLKAEHVQQLAEGRELFAGLRPHIVQGPHALGNLTGSNTQDVRPGSSSAMPPQTTPRQQPNQAVNPNVNPGTSSMPNSHLPQQNPAQNQPQRPMNMQGQSNTPVALSHQEALARSRNSQHQTNTIATNGTSYADQRQPTLADVDAKRVSGQPISKSWLPQAPQPVNMGASRPTLSGANNGPVGPMGQPAIQKPESFLLQGPGDRVLEKKKLDELYRQVCGADAGEGDALNAEVSEVNAHQWICPSYANTAT